MDRKKRIILGIIFGILILTITGTLAYLTWVKKIGRMVLTIGDLSTTEVNVSPYVIEGSFSPVLTYEGEEYSSIRVTNNENDTKNIIVYYEVLNIDSALNSESMKYTITKSSSKDGEYVEYSSGNFVSASNGDKIEILNEKILAGERYYYRVYLWIDGSSEDQSSMIGKNIKLEITAEIQKFTGADMLISKANPSTLSYSDATDSQKGEMWTFSHDATEQTDALTDYRYIGSNPNNYIIFNNETWRIIGVFDGRIKIIRELESNLYWDYKKSGVGSSTSDYGSNDWTDSQLMLWLNNNFLGTDDTILKTGYTYDGTYVKDSNENIIYQKGCKPVSIEAGATSYSCTSLDWTLSSTALSQIDKVTYYLGGTDTSSEKSADDWYSDERSSTVYSGNPTSWNGYVGLMYPSDYVYTFANGVDDKCYTDTIKCRTSKGGTPSNSWLFHSYSHWLLTPYSSNSVFTFTMESTGYFDYGSSNVSSTIGFRRVVYLKSDIKLTGSGISGDPYKIQDTIQDSTQEIVTAEDLINKANPSTLSYNDATNIQKGKMWTFSHESTSQTEAMTDYRYIGDSPNNYITFNNETWRIIGVFDGKIKIIKDEAINFRWDYKQDGVGSSSSTKGSNDWTDSQLMYTLNNNYLGTDNALLKTGYTYDGTYVYDSSSNIIYQNGCQPASIASGAATYSCTSLGWTLNSTALNQIDKVTYYLGGSGSYDNSASDYYNLERGTTVYSGRPTSWNGYVGLMYPSDYGYTFANGVDDTCYDNLKNCNSATPSSSWLYNSSTQWLLAPYSGNHSSFYINASGYAAYYSVYYSYGVRPVVYLKSDTVLKGSGTSSNPYKIQEIITAEDLINKSNPSTLSYSDATTAQKGEMWTFSHEATSQTGSTTDYRYIGSSPNNYIAFNNETWRIIGVFDGRIKIIKDTATSLVWDYKKNGVGSSTSDYGSLDWSDAQLMYALNNNYLGTDDTLLKTGYTYDGTYVKDSSSNIIYQKGCQPASIASGATTYSCTSLGWELNSMALNQIDKVTYYLGGKNTYNLSATDYYNLERGTEVYSGSPTSWNGYVGLMYASDYGYTFANGVDDTCYNNLYNCTTSEGATPSASWLDNSDTQWLFTGKYINYSGRVYNDPYYYDRGYNSNGVRGVVYLKSNIKLRGSGTIDDSYKIQ